MKLGEIESKERAVFLASLLLVGIVFASAVYLYLNPPVQVLEAKVFDVYESNGKTFILTYGEGKFKLEGSYDIEVDAFYRIMYQSRKRNLAYNIISIEKIG